MFLAPLLRKETGFDVGVNLAIMQIAAHNSMNPGLFLIDLLTTMSCYGYDRYKDSEYRQLPEYVYWYVIASCTYLYIDAGLILESPILVVIATSYQKIKTTIGGLKPILIGSLWSYAITGLPHQYDFDLNLFGYYWCTYAAASNLLDLKDVVEDADNNIHTIPVMYGKNITLLLSTTLFASALLIHDGVSEWSTGDTLMDMSILGFLGLIIKEVTSNFTKLWRQR